MARLLLPVSVVFLFVATAYIFACTSRLMKAEHWPIIISTATSESNRLPTTMPLQIQIASDLHIEFYLGRPIPDDIIVPSAPVLALLGDIGLACTDTLKKFLHEQANRFEHVLYVVGNHEFYNHRTRYTVEQQYEWIKGVCNERPNLHFLEKQSIVLGGVKILGTALWSNIPPEKQGYAARSMNDYHLGYMNTSNGGVRNLAPSDTVSWHHACVAWLEQEIASAKEPVLVLTHHTPSMRGTSAPKYEGSDSSYCFSTNLTHLLKPPVKAWACGHTHFNFDGTAGDKVRLVSNQKGYPTEHESRGYNAEFVLEI